MPTSSRTTRPESCKSSGGVAYAAEPIDILYRYRPRSSTENFCKSARGGMPTLKADGAVPEILRKILAKAEGR